MTSTKGKMRAMPSYDSSAFDSFDTPSHSLKRGPGRPRKNAFASLEEDGFSDTVFDDTPQPKVKRPQRIDRDRAESSAPPGSRVVRLRVPGGARGRGRLSGGDEEGEHQVVEEEEEEKVPYGGVITGADAETARTRITERDKTDFERSRRAAEVRLGGPPVTVAFDPLGGASGSGRAGAGSASPAPSDATPSSSTPVGAPAYPSTPVVHPGTASRPGARSMRDRLLDKSVSTPGELGGGLATPTRASAASGSYFSLPLAAGSGVAVVEHSATPSASGETNATPGVVTRQKINKVQIGKYDIDTWFPAPYPEEYQHVPDGRLWLCEFCLKFMKTEFVLKRHRVSGCAVQRWRGDGKGSDRSSTAVKS
jgi:hypothetical protein